MTDLPRPAPDFALPADDGAEITLAGLRGTPFVFFFYPRDNTPGCTKEAIAFTTLKPDFDALGVRIFGISKDSLKSHGNFREKQNLAIGLLSDAETEVCEAFGVWQEKKNYGKTYMGVQRSAFLIDETGRIEVAWPKISPKDTPTNLLAALAED